MQGERFPAGRVCNRSAAQVDCTECSPKGGRAIKYAWTYRSRRSYRQIDVSPRPFPHVIVSGRVLIRFPNGRRTNSERHRGLAFASLHARFNPQGLWRSASGLLVRRACGVEFKNRYLPHSQAGEDGDDFKVDGSSQKRSFGG